MTDTKTPGQIGFGDPRFVVTQYATGVGVTMTLFSGDDLEEFVEAYRELVNMVADVPGYNSKKPKEPKDPSAKRAFHQGRNRG